MRVIFVLLLALFTTSCTFTFTYNNLGWMKDWYIDDYIDFTEQQEKLFNESFDQLHHWHRTEELPRYIESLKAFKAVIESGEQVATETVNVHLDKFQRYANDLLVEASPLIEETLWQLNEEQSESLLSLMNQDNDDFYARLTEEKEDEVIEERQDRSLKQYKKFIGKLSTAQKEMIKASVINIVDTDPHRMAHRKLWQEKFELALQNKNDEQLFKNQLNNLIVNGFELRTEQHNIESNSNKEIYRNLTANIFNSMSNKQRQHLVDYLNDYIDDFRELTEKES